MVGSFESKVIIVTGAGSGIGRAAALAFAAEGAQVSVNDLRADAAQATVDAIRSAGGKAITVVGDVSEAEFVQAMVTRTVEQFGGLDCAFNNAGILDSGDSEEVFRRTLEVNLISIMLCMKFQIPQMLKRGSGAIVNTASIMGLVAQEKPSTPAYIASKHAIIGLTKTAALQYARQNIRVNAVCPGITRTAIVDRAMAEADEATRQYMENFAPMGRIADPTEIADAVLWLCSGKSLYVTGHSLAVDGGFLAR